MADLQSQSLRLLFQFNLLIKAPNIGQAVQHLNPFIVVGKTHPSPVGFELGNTGFDLTPGQIKCLQFFFSQDISFGFGEVCLQNKQDVAVLGQLMLHSLDGLNTLLGLLHGRQF